MLGARELALAGRVPFVRSLRELLDARAAEKATSFVGSGTPVQCPFRQPSVETVSQRGVLLEVPLKGGGKKTSRSVRSQETVWKDLGEDGPLSLSLSPHKCSFPLSLRGLRPPPLSATKTSLLGSSRENARVGCERARSKLQAGAAARSATTPRLNS